MVSQYTIYAAIWDISHAIQTIVCLPLPAWFKSTENGKVSSLHERITVEIIRRIGKKKHWRTRAAANRNEFYFTYVRTQARTQTFNISFFRNKQQTNKMLHAK